MAVAETTRNIRAEARFQRVSPQKARLVLELIKGRRVGEALETVAFTKKGIAPVVEKCCVGDPERKVSQPASRGLDLDVDNLYVKTALANEGPRMKRIRPAPMGRAFRYQRRLSHIVIAVAERNAPSLVTAEPQKAGGQEARTGKRLDPERQEARQEEGSQEDRGKKAQQEGLRVGRKKAAK
jgi:large subunit ribosomal protein L22